MSAHILMRDPARNTWLEFSAPKEIVSTHLVGEVVPLFERVEALVSHHGYHAAGFVSYEAGSAFDAALATRAAGTLPLLWFGIFDRCAEHEHPPELNRGPHLPATWTPLETRDQHRRQVSQLRQRIGAGEVYQVNLTTRLEGHCINGYELFARMAPAAPHATYINADGFEIVSASPELFFRQRGIELETRPMKGTAARGRTSAEDRAQRNWLLRSQKNRAENLMITDMVRNDLGRIAIPGSVTVSELFGIERYPTVWQMTSTVHARSNGSTLDVFRALFPGASITGAPKRASMAAIAAMESTPREVYTGAIGYIAPRNRAQFSIGIRTAWIDKRSGFGRYGVGGGIVWDSQAAEEYSELAAKARILHTPASNLRLLETMLWEPGHGIRLLRLHLDRLADSAAFFDFQFDRSAATTLLRDMCARLARQQQPQRLRLLLARDGALQIQHSGLPPTASPQQLQLAAQPIDSGNVLLYHKTDQRAIYEAAESSASGGSEPLLYNGDGYITESTIANVVYQMQGQLYTPPVSDGLLPGTLRQHLIDRGLLQERSLPVASADRVDAWFLINALRGWRCAYLEPSSGPGT